MRGKVLWITGAAIVLVLSVASVAIAATQDGSTTSPAPQARGAAHSALLEDPAAAADLQALRTEHQADMQAWFDKSGDTSTPAAQAALTKLRAEHQNDMQALLTKYGIDGGLCSGGGMMGGGNGGGNGGGMMGGGNGQGMGGNGCGLVQTN